MASEEKKCDMSTVSIIRRKHEFLANAIAHGVILVASFPLCIL